MNKKTIFYVANVDWLFESQRLPLVLYALAIGYDVYLPVVLILSAIISVIFG